MQKNIIGSFLVAQRFWPYLNYHMPDYVLEGADKRLLRVLGKHPEMALWVSPGHNASVFWILYFFLFL